MRRLIAFLLFCLAGAISPVLAADFEFTPALQRAYADILKLKVQGAQRVIAPEVTRRNGVALYLDNYADMITLLISDDRKAFARFEAREDQRLDALRNLDANSPWQRLLQAEVRLHWAFVKLKFGQEVSASWDIIRAYRLLEENRKKFPNFWPTYKSLGVLHILIGSVPESYTWVTNLLGLKGNVKQGIQEIQMVARKDALFRTEARLIELLVQAYILKFDNADVTNLKQFVSENPDNLMLHFFATTILMKDARSEEALPYLLNRPTGPDYLPFPFTEYLKGEIFLQKGAFQQANQHYRLFLGQYKGLNFLKDTYYKQFLCFWLTDNPGDDAASVQLLRQVSNVGASVVEGDKAAQKFADLYFKKGVSANQKVLMRSRLATDGGYLDTALAVLRPYTEANFSLLAEKAEFNYRKGRILQRREEMDEAIPLFERAIALSEKSQLSFGATAALQLGYVYQQKRNVSQARRYFQKAISFKKHEYKNSVDNKARAALNEIGGD
ncbi:tetratricopeptide repeat protein [Tellurirhabdus bombi]|uniref:tetratricopeptide repeat protein n=1 Tax=Tellurirhabdus bombi TaxID=2907205 RepID=UPI001F44DB87|nr:tetratricopeptide repeat protein [Tellurirhabdus bombi]